MSLKNVGTRLIKEGLPEILEDPLLYNEYNFRLKQFFTMIGNFPAI